MYSKVWLAQLTCQSLKPFMIFLLLSFQLTKNKKLNITQYTVISQAINFLLAGFDTSSTALTFFLYHLALNDDIQEKALQEIKDARDKNDGKITYDTMQDLPYITACISEAMRLYPSIVRLERLCHEDFVHKGMTIKEGTLVVIPTWALHRNPEYFPDPEVFNPDRFMPENKNKIHPYAYLPFGSGPRNCIGMRFAWVQMKVLACYFLPVFRFSICPETQLKYTPGARILVGYEGIRLRIEKR